MLTEDYFYALKRAYDQRLDNLEGRIVALEVNKIGASTNTGSRAIALCKEMLDRLEVIDKTNHGYYVEEYNAVVAQQQAGA